MDDMGGDCSTDGTCEADSGDPELSEGDAAGEKVSLLQGTSLAIQQFSISTSITFVKEEHQMAEFYWSPMATCIIPCMLPIRVLVRKPKLQNVFYWH